MAEDSGPCGVAVSTTPCERGGGLPRQTDAELISYCLQGDNQAWTILLERYSGLIYSIAWKYDLSPEDVADVFQSVCLIMLEGLDRLKDETKLSSWVTTVTLRQCHRVKRRQRQRQRMIDLDQVKEEVANLPDAALPPDEQIQQMEQERLVRQALSMMGEPCRTLLTYLFYEKELWSYEEIAKALKISPSTIGPKRARCLKKLLEILNELGF
jgi:RNA polymerase sigma factor (sigma-70 family)